MLTVIAYLAYVEHCYSGGAGGAVFKGNLQKRSAGSLWGLFKQCVRSTGPRWEFCKELASLASEPLLTEINSAISAAAMEKHGKRGEAVNFPRLLEMLGNTLCRALNEKVVGYFEETRLKPFSMNRFQGLFRGAIGPSPTFIRIFKYEGTENFPSEFLFIVDLATGRALPLFPLLVRGLERGRAYQHEPDVFMYDIRRESGIAYRAVQLGEEISVGGDQFADLRDALGGLFGTDPLIKAIAGISLQPRGLD